MIFDKQPLVEMTSISAPVMVDGIAQKAHGGRLNAGALGTPSPTPPATQGLGGCTVRRVAPFMQVRCRPGFIAARKSCETPEIVASRIRRALPYVPVKDIIIAPDFGMKYLPRDIAFGKMRAMVDGAKIDRAEVGGSASPHLQ